MIQIKNYTSFSQFYQDIEGAKTKQEMLEACASMISSFSGGFTNRGDILKKILGEKD